MLTAKLRQYTWDELLRPFGDAGDVPITDEEFEDLMKPTNDARPYCSSANEGIRTTYFDQTCKGCVERRHLPNVQIEGLAATKRDRSPESSKTAGRERTLIGQSRSNAGLGFDLPDTFDDESIFDFLEADLGVILHCFWG
jgi:hypothetical protein